MDYPKIIDSESYPSRLILPVCIFPDADMVVEQSGHTPNGYFWAGVVEWLLRGPLSDLCADFDLDPEGDTFVAYSKVPSSLVNLEKHLRDLLTDPNSLRILIDEAHRAEFDFDD